MPWSPLDLILAGDTGGWFDPSDFSRAFQDAAGTVPVTGFSQPVGRMTTGAGAGSACFDLTQATSSAQPKSHSEGLLYDGTDWLDSGIERFGDTGLYCAAGEAFTVAISYASLPTFGTLIARASAVSADKTFQLFRGGGGYLIELRGAQTVVTGMGSAATVVIFRWDGSQAQITVNGGTWQTCSVGTVAENIGQRIIVGARTNGTGLLLPNNARTTRLFFLDRAISDTEASYLKHRLGTSVGLTIGTEPPEGGTVPGNASASWPTVTLTAPAGAATGAANDGAGAPVVTLSPVAGQASGAARASADWPALNAVPPTGAAVVVEGGSPGTGNGAVPAVTIGPPVATARGAAAVAGALPPVGALPPTGQALVIPSGLASGAFPDVAVSPWTGRAIGSPAISSSAGGTSHKKVRSLQTLALQQRRARDEQDARDLAALFSAGVFDACA